VRYYRNKRQSHGNCFQKWRALHFSHDIAIRATVFAAKCSAPRVNRISLHNIVERCFRRKPIARAIPRRDGLRLIKKYQIGSGDDANELDELINLAPFNDIDVSAAFCMPPARYSATLPRWLFLLLSLSHSFNFPLRVREKGRNGLFAAAILLAIG